MFTPAFTPCARPRSAWLAAVGLPVLSVAGATCSEQVALFLAHALRGVERLLLLGRYALVQRAVGVQRALTADPENGVDHGPFSHSQRYRTPVAGYEECLPSWVMV